MKKLQEKDFGEEIKSHSSDEEKQVDYHDFKRLEMKVTNMEKVKSTAQVVPELSQSKLIKMESTILMLQNAFDNGNFA